MVRFKQEWVEDFLRDPVMAAYALLGMDLDVFQAARLRYYWWCPMVIDSSGVSSGKTATNFAYLALRCILLRNHVAAVYFPNFQTGKDEFWPYFAATIERSPVFREQLQPHHKKLGEHLNPGAWIMQYKNGNRTIMPAPSFLQDAATQATRRFNTLVVDDWLRAEDMGEGIGKQLVDRVTRESFNQHHPLWANHVKLLGHAETPQHKGYARVLASRRAVREGSTTDATITFCFKDWTPKFAKRFLVQAIITKARQTLSKDQFNRQWLGIWTRDGATFYPETVLIRSCRTDLIPVFRRMYDREVNFLGFDTAAGQSIKADWCAAVVLRLVELGERSVLPMTMMRYGRRFHASFTYAHMLRNAGGMEIAGFIHLLHRVFSFSWITLDPGGGGLFVYKDLKREEQIINNAKSRVTGLCTPEDWQGGGRQPIVLFFKRGTLFDPVFESQYLVSDDGFLNAAHRMYRESWEAGQVLHPQLIQYRAPAEMRGWTPQQQIGMKVLDTGLRQLMRVRQVTDSEGRPLTSKRGFTMFHAPGKKDVAYAGLYARCAMEVWFKQWEANGGDDEVELVG